MRLARLRVLSDREVCRIPAANGFVEVRQQGSHIAMRTGDAGGKLTIPVPDRRELRAGTLMSIIRQSGLPRAEFETGVRYPSVRLVGDLRERAAALEVRMR